MNAIVERDFDDIREQLAEERYQRDMERLRKAYERAEADCDYERMDRIANAMNDL